MGLDEKKLAFDHVEDAKVLQRSDSDEAAHDLYTAVRPRKTSEEKQAQLKLAQAADPGFHWASMRALQFLGMILVVCCCGGDTGLDATSEFEKISCKLARALTPPCTCAFSHERYQRHETIPKLLWNERWRGEDL